MENIVAEYHANELRFKLATKCEEHLRAAAGMASPTVGKRLANALAAADGARRGYSWRDDELHADAVRAGKWPEIMAAEPLF